ncbi:hypothetical protein RHMOL_Rhmol05G0041400 [Rhododendron molle]|uniref:Uncharacterized protein n=1 Tax=Rhododendron molle TaxID=49168 RepID=A0ACC0NMP5_RHOML|nr:hypothetical protein RHMOL_Rhmol05G0041400 [Rhododendron molle]
MDNNYAQPLPPGVQSLPNSLPFSASPNQSTQPPPHPFQNSAGFHHHAYFAPNHLFPVPVPIQPIFIPPKVSIHKLGHPHILNMLLIGLILPQLTFSIVTTFNLACPHLLLPDRILRLLTDRPYESASNSRLHLENVRDIEASAQDAVLREQEVATQNIIQSQRHTRGASGPPEDGTDIFSGRHDPNELKEHLLKMTTDHRAEMALKRRKSTVPEEGCFLSFL